MAQIRNGKGQYTTKGVSSSWFKNVAKSLGYTSSELVSSMSPSISEFVSVNVEYGKELAADLKDLKSSGNRFKSAFNNNAQVGIAKSALKNALEDIKSGKIYNKERQDKIYDVEGEFDMADFSFDEGQDGEKGISNITIRNVQAPISKDSPIIKSLDQNTQAVYKSAQSANETQIAIATNKMVLDHKNTARTLKGLQTINDNIGMLVNFQNDSMTKYIGASIKYYEESLKTMGETLTELKKSHSEPAQRSQEVDKHADVFLPNGGLNMKGYAGMVKKNFKEQFSSNPMLAPLKMMFEDTDTLKYLAASPLSFISTKIVTTLIPSFLQQSMQRLDKSFSAFFPAMFMRFNKMTAGSSNPFMQMIGDIFGVNPRSKSTIDLSKYHKGAMSFDGETKKAITEVIPTYLRKILAAISGDEEIAFDKEMGKFKTVTTMKKDFERSRESTALAPFTEVIDEIKQQSKMIVMESMEDRKTFMDGVNKFFIELTKRDHLVDPRVKRDKNTGALIDDMSEVFNFKDNPGLMKMFRQIVLNLPKSQQMQMFGGNVIESRRSQRQMMLDAEADPGRLNANILFNDSTMFDKDSKTGEFKVKKGHSLFNPKDKFNLTALDYLRNIQRILLQGIRVFPTKGGGSGGGTPDHISKGLANMGVQESKETEEKNEREKRKFIDINDTARLKLQANGQKVVGGSSDINEMSDEEIGQLLKNYNDVQKSKDQTASKNGGVLQWVGKFLKGDKQEKFNLMREKIDQMLAKPAQLLESVFNKIDNVMYDMVFGKSTDGKETSFFSKTMANLREKFRQFGNFMQTKVLDPLKETLFGKEGLITQLKDSDFFKGIKTKMKGLGDYVFGKPSGPDGKREGGLMSDTANSMVDMWKGAKYYFTGKGYKDSTGKEHSDNENSVFGEVKKMFRSFKDTMSEYLMGTKDPETGKRNGILTGIIDSLKGGFQNFNDAIFGPKDATGKRSNDTVDQIIKKVKERAPKSLAAGMVGGGAGLLMGGKLGLLGSLLLPGGPIGGAIVGTTVGYLAQSDRFKNWMFGSKDPQGKRAGGLISKSTQDWFKKNRVPIIGGAGLGIMKGMLGGFGILPSFLLPGGPIGGAMMGIGTAMLVRSETFQKFMFGEKNQDGKRVGGMMQKLFGKNAKGKSLAGNVGAGALGGAGLGLVASHLGIMGAMLVPGGPIGGAILGAAAGIALSSEKWKKALFGEFDEKTNKRKGGLLGKFTNWFKLEVQEPLKLQFRKINLNMKEWFTKAVANPFMDAIAPIKHEFKLMTKRMTDMFKAGWDSFKGMIGNVFEKHVGKPFGEFMKENVMKPLKGFFTKILGGLGNMFKSIIGAPFKALSSISEGLVDRHKKNGVKEYRQNVWDSMFSKEARAQRKESGERLTMGDIVAGVQDMYFNKQMKTAAENGAGGAPYAKELEAEKAARNATQQAAFDKERQSIANAERTQNTRRKFGEKHDYENFDEHGNYIGDKYSQPKSRLSELSAAEDAIKKAMEENSPKEEIKDELIPEVKETNKILTAIKNIWKHGTGASDEEVDALGVKLPGIKRMSGMFGRIKATIQKHSHASGIDNVPHDGYNAELHRGEMVIPARQANYIRKLFGVPQVQPSQQTGPVNGSNQGVNSIGRTPDTLGGGSSKSLLQRIADDVRIIAASIKGQLDGVGSNVFKMRKLMQTSTGTTDADLTGSANKDRGSLMGKLRRAMFKPLDFVRDKLTQSFKFISEKVTAFGTAIKNGVKAILMVPVNIVKGIWNFTKEVGGLLKEAGLALLKIPGQLLGIVNKGLGIALETMKTLGPAIGETLKGVASVFAGTMKMVGHTIAGFGKGVGNLLGELGKGTGELIVGFGKMTFSLLATTGKFLGKGAAMLADFTLNAAKTAVNFTLSTVKMLGEKLLDVGKTMLEIVTSPLKMLGKLLGFKQEVTVKGGHLDTVGTVHVIERIGGGPGPSSRGSSSTHKPMIVALDPSSLVKAFKQILPLPVTHIDMGSSQSVSFFNSALTGLKPASGMGNSPAITTLYRRVASHNHNGAVPAGPAGTITPIGVRRKTADYQMTQMSAKFKEKMENYRGEMQLTLLQKIAEATTVHKDSWLKMFGPKGVLAVALIAALPFLKDIINAVKGLVFNGPGNSFGWGENQGPARTDANGDHVANGTQREDIVKGGAKAVAKVAANPLVKLGARLAAPVVEAGIKVAKPIFKAGAQLAKPLIEPITKAISNTAGNIADKAMKTIGQSNAVKGAVIGINMKANVVAQGIQDTADKIIKQIKEIFSKFLASDFVKGKLGPAMAAASAEIMPMVEKVFSKETVTKYMGKLSGAFIKTGAKEGAAVLTLGITDAAFAAWDLTSGAFEAAHMFHVNEEAVDAKMRIASSVSKALFGYFPIVSVLIDIFGEITGMDLKEYVATAMYSALSSSEDVKKLEENKNAFKQEVDAYNKANGTKLTANAYNDKVNKSLWQKVTDPIGNAAKNVWGGIKAGAKGAWNGIKAGAQWAGNGIKAGAQAIGQGAQWLGGKIADGASWAGGKIAQGASAAWGGIKAAGGAIAGGAKSLWNHSALGGMFNGATNTDMIKSNFGITGGNGKITTGMRVSSGLGQGLSAATFGLVSPEAITKKIYAMGLTVKDWWDKIAGVVTNVGKSIWDATTKVWNSITTTVSNIWDGIVKAVTPVIKTVTDAATAVWNSITSTVSSIWDGIVNTVTPIVTAVVDTAKALWGGISDAVSTGWNWIKTTVSDVATGIWDGTKKLWGAVSDVVIKGWDTIKTTVTDVGQSIWGGVKKAWDAIATPISDAWTRVKDAISTSVDFIVGGVKTAWDAIAKPISDAWTTVKTVVGNATDGILTTIKNVLDAVANPFKKAWNWLTGSGNDKTDKAMHDLGWETAPQGGNGPDSVTKNARKRPQGGFGGEPDKINNFAYYSQNDDRWKDYNYDYSPQVGGHASNPQLSYRGCGPTSMAMVTSQLTGKQFTPPQLAQLARDGGYSTADGTTWNYFDAMAKKFSLTEDVIDPKGNSQGLMSYLRAGTPVILSGRRTAFGADESPFTTAGHFVVATGMNGNKISINDPRGPQYSKDYDLKKVLTEARQGWAFSYQGGPVPDAITSPADMIGKTTNNSPGMTIMDLFGKVGENFSTLISNLFSGENKGLTWGDDATIGASATGGKSPINIDFLPKTIQDKILKKTAELTASNESGGDYTLSKNDVSSQTGQPISPSIGVLQWRGPNAQRLMTSIASRMPNDPTAQYYAKMNWNNDAPWSAQDQSKLHQFLSSNMDVVKKSEDEMLLSYVKDSNLDPVYRYGVATGKIKDPRSIAMLAEFANTGPGLVQSFMNAYSPTNGAEFPHFLDEFKSKSYWGSRAIYNSRIKNDIASLNTWDPEQSGGFGIGPSRMAEGCGGFGDLSGRVIDNLSGGGSQGVAYGRSAPSVPKQYMDSYRTQPVVIDGGNSQLMQQAVDVLKTIATHTGNTHQSITDLASQSGNSSQVTNEGDKNIILVNGGSQNTNISPVTGMQAPAGNPKQSADYSSAKGIASGRKR